MTYGTIKVDTVTFTNDGVDKSVTLSGLVQNPTFSGNVTVTGTLSGVTVTGTTANFTSGNFTNISGGTHTITSGVFAAGSAASPSITFTGDLNTGIYSPGADQVAISTGGSGRLFVDASGRVGIGGSPSTALHLGGSSSQTIRINSNTSAGFVGTTGYITQIAANRNPIDGSIVNTGTATAFINLEADVSNGNIQFCTTGTNNASALERMRITSGGLVGIGTSSPATNLEVYGAQGTILEALRLRNQNAGVAGVRQTFWQDYLVAAFTASRNGLDGRLALQTTDTSGNLQDRLFIDGSGRVGIGTTSPTTTLDCRGVISTNDAIYCYNTARDGLGIWYNPGGAGVNQLTARVAGGDRLTIDSSGRVGIGTTSPSTALDVSGELTFSAGGAGWRTAAIKGIDEGGSFRGGMAFYTHPTAGAAGAPTERARIDSSGRLLVGTSSARGNFFNSTVSPLIQQEGISGSGRFMSVTYGTASEDDPIFILGKHRGASIGGNTVVANGDGLGKISFQGSDGSELVEGAAIRAEVDGTPGANDMPGRLVFSTTADGASSPTEHVRITNYGGTFFNTTGTPTVNANFGVTIGQFNGGARAGTLLTSANFDGTYFIAAFHGTAGYAQIMGDGDLENTNNRYTGISDIKFKQNVEDASSQWNDLKAIRVRKYELIANPDRKHIGCVAQELEQVCPGLVVEREGSNGDSYKSVAYSVLYMKAVKALQEAMERIETLEAKVAALEAS